MPLLAPKLNQISMQRIVLFCLCPPFLWLNRDRTKKSNWLDQNSPQALRLVPTIARIKTYDKEDLYLFPPSKMLPVSWDRAEQTELLSSLRRIPGPLPAGPPAGVGSQLSQAEGAQPKRDVLIQVLGSPAPSEFWRQ